MTRAQIQEAAMRGFKGGIRAQLREVALALHEQRAILNRIEPGKSRFFKGVN